MDWLSFSLGLTLGIIACVFAAIIVGLILAFWVHKIDQNDTIY
ncbi:hypothetical protein RvVAT039_02480 [Agrobacterium vitis]|nr:hypothetical protein [Agrobacterium vitis]BCH63032.1 hypothetical protein RvVAT039_02480 [Agrobacterium vitis]